MEILRGSEATKFYLTTETEVIVIKKFQQSLWIGSLQPDKRPFVFTPPEDERLPKNERRVACVVPLLKTALVLENALRSVGCTED